MFTTQFLHFLLYNFWSTSRCGRRLRFGILTLLKNIDNPRSYGGTVTIPRTVTIQLQPFLPFLNLPLKHFYHTGIWLSNIIIGHEFCVETYMDGRQPLMEDNLAWKTTFDGRQPSMEDDLQWNRNT